MSEHRETPYAYQPVSKIQSIRLRLMIVVSLMLLLMGFVSPMLTLTKLVFFQNSLSILTGILELLNNGQFVLFLLIFSFSVLLPLLKIYVLFRITSSGMVEPHAMQRYLRLMHEYGRWSMLDVMVVAVLIVTVKLGAIASIEVHYGLYVFAVAVLMIMFITSRVVKLTAATVLTEQAPGV
ncbi:MAG: paraquat-inducible protein A [Gammaproteobacteria bacterium]|nr:paraquat-inducible protein A [Gammaproteobacteria bacterium]